MSPRTQLGLSLAAAAAGLGAVAAVMVGLHIDQAGTAEAARSNLAALRPFWLASGLGWAALTGVWLALRRVAPAPPGSRQARRAAFIVLAVAAAARVAVVVGHDPALSDDVYRYVFDGRNLAAGINPYLVRPLDRAAAGGDTRWAGEAAVAARINNPQMHTIYLPATQWAFAAVGLAVPEAWSGPDATTRVFRVVFVIVELAAIAVLLVALRPRSPWWAALYAWHPLALSEIAGSGHVDVLGVALLVVALAAGARSAVRVWRWTVPLALATMVKPVVLPVAAFILKGQRWSVWVRSALIGAAVCTAVSAPLLLDRDARTNLAATAQRFRLKWAHYGAVYEPLLWTIEQAAPQWTNDRQEVLARRICVALVAAVLAALWLKGPASVWAAARCLLLAMVLLSPAAHPWYLLWALALVPMAPGAATWIASLTLPWGYAAWGHVGPDGAQSWGVSPWLMLVAYSPVACAIVVQSARHLCAIRRDPSSVPLADS